MRKIDLNELYGGYWEWVEETGLFGVKHRCADLDWKPLKEHIEEWLKIPTDAEKLPFGCLSGEAITYLLDILEGRVTTLGNDDGIIKFEYEDKDMDDEENWCKEEDCVIFKPLSLIKDEIRDEAREQGIKPPKTWYREEVDRIAYQIAHPSDSGDDDLPF